MSTLHELFATLQITPEVDLCPVCGASGMAPCVEEDGQYVLDHYGRSVTLPTTPEDAAAVA